MTDVPLTAGFLRMLGLMLISALLGATAVGVWRGVHTEQVEREPGRSRLVDLVVQRTAVIDQMREEILSLQDNIDRSFRDVDQGVADDLAEARRRSGLAEISGPAVLITLHDAARADGQSAAPCRLRICDRDLQRVVNVAWSAGATAISVNAERLTATSAIRQAGSTITVNYRPLTPPYEVVALGARGDTVAESNDLGVLKTWADRTGIGVSVETVDAASVPAYGGSVDLKFAEPAAQQDTRHP
ncbi:MAG: DUF881 domain-containing protein [Acidimicrobiia bacterium]|nr:DUF881 domain-containing protein [Acidimicrobiia bacterium]